MPHSSFCCTRAFAEAAALGACAYSCYRSESTGRRLPRRPDDSRTSISVSDARTPNRPDRARTPKNLTFSTTYRVRCAWCSWCCTTRPSTSPLRDLVVSARCVTRRAPTRSPTFGVIALHVSSCDLIGRCRRFRSCHPGQQFERLRRYFKSGWSHPSFADLLRTNIAAESGVLALTTPKA